MYWPLEMKRLSSSSLKCLRISHNLKDRFTFNRAQTIGFRYTYTPKFIFNTKMRIFAQHEFYIYVINERILTWIQKLRRIVKYFKWSTIFFPRVKTMLCTIDYAQLVLRPESKLWIKKWLIQMSFISYWSIVLQIFNFVYYNRYFIDRFFKTVI